MSDTREAKARLKIRYGNMCMLTGTKLKLTYHHTVVKRVDCKKSSNPIKGETVENGSLLTEKIHCKFLHSILEKECPICYEGTTLLILRYKEAIDNRDEEYIQWHIDNVMPVFNRMLSQMDKKKNKVRRRAR